MTEADFERRRRKPEADTATHQADRTIAPAVIGQPQLVVGAADDHFEREADRVADLVVGGAFGPSSGVATAQAGRISRTTSVSPSVSPVRRRIQRREVIGADGGSLDADTERSLQRARSGGSAIDKAAQQHLSGVLGADVSGVRLHAGSASASLNEGMSAKAFAVGNDVFFRDGIPDSSEPEGMRLLAHEVTHTVQQGSSPISRSLMVRRKLAPKAAEAFTAAVASNASFSTGRDNTDRYAKESDQEDLSRVHGRMHIGKDSAEQQQVAKMVRAVVLTEYSSRLAGLDGANGKDGTPMGEGQKAAKRKLYKTKADEFRQKHTPLVAKGFKAPETQAFLAEHGLDATLAPSKQQQAAQRVAGARIEVRSTFIGGPILGIRVRAHLFIVYTAKDGRQMYFRGGPDEAGNTVADMGDYRAGTIDWDPSAPSVTVAEGTAAEGKLDKLQEATSVINAMQVPYRGAIAKEFGGDNPNGAQDVLNQVALGFTSEGENCNATAWTILNRAGVKKDKPMGKHPGWGANLGSRTTGKENALPAAEVVGAGVDYTIDQTRDVADKRGIVQIFDDRLMFQPQTRVGHGTKVSLIEETEIYRKVSMGGRIGFIPRAEGDKLLSRYAAIVAYMRSSVDQSTLEAMRDSQPDDFGIEDYSERTGIPADLVIRFAAAALGADNGEVATPLIQIRLDQLGPARAREMLTNPDELARLAAELGVDPGDLVDAATAMVGDIEAESRVPGELAKYFPGPQGASEAMSEAPDYTALAAISSTLHVSFDKVWALVNRLRPTAVQAATLHGLLNDDPIAKSELPDVAGYMVKSWAKQLGVSEDYVKRRLVKIHEGNVAAKQRAATQAAEEKQAAARAKAERLKNAVTTTATLSEVRGFIDRLDLGDDEEAAFEDLVEQGYMPAGTLAVRYDDNEEGGIAGIATKPSDVNEFGESDGWMQFVLIAGGQFCWAPMGEWDAFLAFHAKKGKG